MTSHLASLSDWPLFHGLRVVFSPALWAGGSHPIKRWDPGTHCLPWPWSSLDPLHPPREAWEPERPPESTRGQQKCSKFRVERQHVWKKNLGNFSCKAKTFDENSVPQRVVSELTSSPYSTIVILKFNRPPRATWAPPFATWLQVGGMRIPTMAMWQTRRFTRGLPKKIM